MVSSDLVWSRRSLSLKFALSESLSDRGDQTLDWAITESKRKKRLYFSLSLYFGLSDGLSERLIQKNEVTQCYVKYLRTAGTCGLSFRTPTCSGSRRRRCWAMLPPRLSHLLKDWKATSATRSGCLTWDSVMTTKKLPTGLPTLSVLLTGLSTLSLLLTGLSTLFVLLTGLFPLCLCYLSWVSFLYKLVKCCLCVAMISVTH